MVLHVEDIEQFNELQNANKRHLIVIDFYATWCAPCKRIAPAFEELPNIFPDVVFVKVDIDVAEDMMKSFKVTSMPTFVFVKSGSEINRMSGTDLGKLTTIIKENCDVDAVSDN